MRAVQLEAILAGAEEKGDEARASGALEIDALDASFKELRAQIQDVNRDLQRAKDLRDALQEELAYSIEAYSGQEQGIQWMRGGLKVRLPHAIWCTGSQSLHQGDLWSCSQQHPACTA